MTDRNIPPDWFAAVLAGMRVALAGAAGAFVRQVNGPDKTRAQRSMEWLAGALCALYATDTVSTAILRAMERLDLVSAVTGLTPEKVTGLAGFLCGAVGITILEMAVKALKKRLKD